PASRYTSWYKFQDARNETYAGFANIDEMPELNFRSADMRARLLQMARFWMDMDNDGDMTDGVDGFRFDVAKGPPHDFWRELRHEVKGLRPDFLLLGEVWDNAETIGSYFHDQYDMNFDYPLYYAMLELLGGKKTPVQFLSAYAAVRRTYPPGAQLVRFLDNHDNNRIASILGADPGRQRLATGLLFTLPGTPLIYYGMEVGMEGMKPDPDIRRPMRWDLVEEQNPDSTSLLSWHRDLIRLRHTMPALTAPDDPAAPSLEAGRASSSPIAAESRCGHRSSWAVVSGRRVRARCDRAS
ncbi:MAG: glycosidase, partial [bacterium]